MLVTILKKYVWVANLLLLTALAYVLAVVVNGKIETGLSSNNAVASPNFSTTESQPNTKFKRQTPKFDYSVIASRNIFGIQNIGGNSGPTLSEGDPIIETSLNLVLLGTILKAENQSSAIIKNADNNKVDGYKVGETLSIIDSEEIKLVRVDNCEAVIHRAKKGKETILCKKIAPPQPPTTTRLDPKETEQTPKKDTDFPGINKLSDHEFEVSRQLLEDVLSDPTQIVQQARVIPQKDGLRFFGIRSNSIFSKIGIKNGDTMKTINNVELNDVEKALGVFEELRNQSYFTIEYQRAGKDYKNEYTVK